MGDLKEEIREKGTFEVLTREVEKLLGHEKGEEALRKESERLKNLAEELQRTIADEKIANEQEKRRMLNELAEEQVAFPTEFSMILMKRDNPMHAVMHSKREKPAERSESL